MKRLSIIAFTAIGACAQTPAATNTPSPTGFASAADLQQLSGTFASSGGEDWGKGTFGHREFVLDRGKWSLRFTLALDPAMTKPVFDFRTLGTYSVGASSPTVAHAFETTFTEEKKFVTLRTADPELAKAFGLAACGLSVGVEKDVSIEGCALWRPVADCGRDFDLLALDQPDRLFFGVRPADNDMCTPDKRPTALLPAVVRR